mmetsp:Transcript_11622/g.23302  ORF Transcript_11622/g.23302 Transcript_11622/m.23302 type:complete len:246 (+) Transcript_11622:100-837(+)
MIIRLTYLASAFSLAAASKSSKSSVTAPTAPVDTAKAGKSASASVSLSLSPKSGKSSGPTPTDAAKAAKSSSPNASKSGKSSKAGEYFIAPFSCPQTCISGQNYAMLSGEIDDAVMVCDASNEYQMWKVHIDGTFLKFESVAHNDEGMCLAVGEECGGLLGLLDCNHPGTNWFNTGGQFLSASCWNQGVSAALSVDESCTDLTVDNSSSAITKSETFMLLESDFIESIIIPSQAPSVSLAPTVTP